MAEMVDVYVKIVYKKDGIIKKDDLFNGDDELSEILLDFEDEVDYVNEEKGIFMTTANWNYLNNFSLSKEVEKFHPEIYRAAQQKGIEDIYYIHCDGGYSVERIDYGVVHIDIKNEKNPEVSNIKSYEFDEYIIDKCESLREKKEILLEDDSDEDLVEEFYDELESLSYAFLKEKFSEFVLEIEDKVDKLEYKKF